jgi:hypothetical protein
MYLVFMFMILEGWFKCFKIINIKTIDKKVMNIFVSDTWSIV